MTETSDQKYASYTKKAWIIYSLIAVALMAVLVLLIASDTEERFFFGIMTPAAFYVLRPTTRYMDRLIFKFTGVSRPADQE
jgi:hypothetical protein